jgi:hypothetical protein
LVFELEILFLSVLHFGQFLYFKKSIGDEQDYIYGCIGNKKHLPFDFYLPDYNTYIEYDGKQHFQKSSKYFSDDLIKNDRIKDKYCLDNNINLIRISFLNIKNIKNIIDKILQSKKS